MKALFTLLAFFTSIYLNAQQATNAVRQHALNIISGKAVPMDDSLTIVAFDSICISTNSATRQFYFNAYKVGLIKADGALAETMGTFAICYLERYTDEALNNFVLLTETQQQQYISFVAFEFWEENYRKQIVDYFAKLRANAGIKWAVLLNKMEKEVRENADVYNKY